MKRETDHPRAPDVEIGPKMGADEPSAIPPRTPWAVEAPDAFPIVGIGASAGGLEAFVILFKAMPPDSGMGGKEAITRLLAVHPDARVVVSSGYANDPIMLHYGSYGFRGRVFKPIDILDLTRVLNDLIT
jgi:hypothetical protein